MNQRLGLAIISLAVPALFGVGGCDYSRYEHGLAINDASLRRVRSFDPATASTAAPSTQPLATTLPTTLPADKPTATAPAEVSLTIEQCRQLAVQNNLDLKVELFNPTIAEQAVNIERARFESLFTASAGYATTDQSTASQLNQSQGKLTTAAAGVDVPLQTGGDIRFNLPVARSESNNSFTTLNPAYSSDFAASISLPLLRGAGPAVNSHGIRVATLQYQAAQAATKLRIISVLADVDRIYWRLYAARRELEVRKKEYDLAVAQLDRARRQVQAGALAEVEVVRAESGVADKIEGVITAQTSLRDRERELKQIINQPGLELATVTTVIPASDPNVLRFELNRSDLLRAALDGRMEMVESEIQIATQKDNIDFARNQLLPLLTVDYTYNVNALGGTLSDSFQTLRRKKFEDHSVAVNLEVPIGNAAARAQLRQALASRLQAIATKAQRTLLIENDVLHAIDQLEANWQRILAAQRRVILAARVVDLETRQFNQGLRTSTDVLDAQTSLANAQTSEIVAVTEYQIAQVDIAFATGTLLGASAVDWKPVEAPKK